MPSLSYHRDLLDAHPDFAAGCCVTITVPSDVARVRSRIGDPVTPAGTRTYREAAEAGLVLLDQAGDAAVTLEPHGWQGARSDVLRALSDGGCRAVSVLWAGTGRCRLRRAADGELEPESSLDIAAALTEAERLTGVRLDDTWLARARPAVALTPAPSDVVPDRFARHPALAGGDLRLILAGPRPDDLPELAALTAELVTRHTGIAEEPAVAEALTTLRAPDRDDSAVLARLTELADRYARLRDSPNTPAEDVPPAFYRHHAVLAVAAALGPDPGEAAWQACFRSGYAVGGDFGDQLRLEVLRRLVERARDTR